MPVVYATPEPFAPGISSAYGAALQWSQDAPGIIGANNAANQLQAANSSRADELRFRYAAANADMQDRQAQRYFQSQVQNADREQSAMNLGAQLTSRNDIASAEMQAQMDGRRQQAELQSWLNQQELSQRDVMRLQQMKAAVSEIQNSKLPEEVKQEQILGLKTGIDQMEQRYKGEQARQLEMRTQLMQGEIRRAKEAEVANQQFEVDARAKGIGVMKWVDPETGKIHPLIQNPRTQEWYNPLSGQAGSGKAAKPPEFDYAAAEKEALAEAKARVGLEPPKPAAGSLDPNATTAAADYHKKLDEAFRDIYQRRMRDFQLKNGEPPTPVQKMELQTAGVAEQIQALMARPDLPPQIKGPVARDLAGAATMIQRAGGVDELTKPEKEFVAQAIKAFNDLPKPTPPQQPAAAAPQEQQGYFPRLGNWLGDVGRDLRQGEITRGLNRPFR